MRQHKTCLSHFIHIEVLNKCYLLWFIMKSRPFRAQGAITQKRRHCQKLLLEQPVHQVLSRECSRLTQCWRLFQTPTCLWPSSWNLTLQPKDHTALSVSWLGQELCSVRRGNPIYCPAGLLLPFPVLPPTYTFSLPRMRLFYPHPSTVTQSSEKEKASTFREQCF